MEDIVVANLIYEEINNESNYWAVKIRRETYDWEEFFI